MEMLQDLTGKKNVLLTSRCNKAIHLALKWARQMGYSDLCIPDQGGWITYAQYGKKEKFQLHELATDLGMIDFSQVREKSVLLFHDMAAYAFIQEYDYEMLKDKGVLVIADTCGSIGQYIPDADIVVCSFGNAKMVNFGYGGMLASNMQIPFESDFDKEKKRDLKLCLKELPDRVAFLKEIRAQVLEDLADFDILRPDVDGVNVIVRFSSEEEKEKILAYCAAHELEYRLCPFKIRVLCDAVSIEIKRKVL